MQITVTSVLERIVGRDEKIVREGKIVILSTSTSTQIPNHKTKKATYANNTVNKLLDGNLRKITNCLLTRFSQLQVDIQSPKKRVINEIFEHAIIFKYILIVKTYLQQYSTIL